jgi:hypothetical protein
VKPLDAQRNEAPKKTSFLGKTGSVFGQIAVDASQSTLRASKKNPPRRWEHRDGVDLKRDRTALVVLELRHCL